MKVPWVIINDKRSTLVYDGTPGPTTLAAAHTEGGASEDLWGTPVPDGDWCSEGYELLDLLELRRGVFLRRKSANHE